MLRNGDEKTLNLFFITKWLGVMAHAFKSQHSEAEVGEFL